MRVLAALGVDYRTVDDKVIGWWKKDPEQR